MARGPWWHQPADALAYRPSGRQAQRMPLGRIGRVGEIARAALVADGGWTAR
jgi:hypothetical protein